MTLLDTQVKDDYETMLGTTEQYRKDAEMIDQLVGEFSGTAQELKVSMEGIIKAIDVVTITINEGAGGAEDITIKTSAIVEKIVEVQRQMQINRQSASELKALVGLFKI
jgi:methyl-accepting chemotaxis protein